MKPLSVRLDVPDTPSWKQWTVVLPAAFLLVFVLFVGSNILTSWRAARFLQNDGQEVMAEIVDRTGSVDAKHSYYYLDYRYAVAGKTYTSREPVPSQVFMNTQKGSRLPLIYSRSSPEICMRPGHPRDASILTSSILLVIVVLLLGWLIVFSYRHPER